MLSYRRLRETHEQIESSYIKVILWKLQLLDCCFWMHCCLKETKHTVWNIVQICLVFCFVLSVLLQTYLSDVLLFYCLKYNPPRKIVWQIASSAPSPHFSFPNQLWTLGYFNVVVLQKTTKGRFPEVSHFLYFKRKK